MKQPLPWVTHFWQAWALATVVAFFVVEIWALKSLGWQNTLSANVWRALKENPAHPGSIMQWTALRYLSACVYLALTSWLFGHFFLGWWRG